MKQSFVVHVLLMQILLLELFPLNMSSLKYLKHYNSICRMSEESRMNEEMIPEAAAAAQETAGTEDIIKGDDRIALFSLYQETAFPFGLQPAQASNIVNAPMPEGSDGADVLKVVNDVWIPKLLMFKPDLILVSAGFDAHRDEKQALFKLTEFDYSFMTIEVMRVARAVCGGRLVSILEGGYDIRSLARSAIAHITTLTRAA